MSHKRRIQGFFQPKIMQQGALIVSFREINFLFMVNLPSHASEAVLYMNTLKESRLLNLSASDCKVSQNAHMTLEKIGSLC